MSEKVMENNQASMTGQVVSKFIFSHEILGEGFYTADLKVNRLSDSSDVIPLMVSERLVNVEKDYQGEYLSVNGQFRSYNRHDESKNRLVLSMFVKEIGFAEKLSEDAESNRIYLDGYVCKEPVYRKTPLGREITDLLLAVNRTYGKSDYIPCICWGRTARFAAEFSVGDRCELWGRMQSRIYMKKLNEEVYDKRVAYEVSVSKLELKDE